MRIYRAEAISAVLIAVVATLAVSLAAIRGIPIDFASFAMPYSVGLALTLVAICYRVTGRSANISLAMASCAIFICFSNSGAMLNYALLPVSRPLIDDILFRADATIGFDWKSLSIFVADYPAFSRMLAFVYGTSLMQLAAVILLLGFTGRHVGLHRFLLTGVFASCLSIFVWFLTPSFGPSAYIPLDPVVDMRLGRVVDAQYGAKLLTFAQYGPDVIAGDRLIGLIAFPSMHTVMAAMSVWFTRRTPVFWPCVALNLLMIPAILVHGGHHLVDIFAGLSVFALSLWAARRLVLADATPAVFADQAQLASGGRLIRMASMLPPVFRPNRVPRS